LAVRIVHLNPFYFPFAGGIERRIRSVSRRLAAAGHEVHVVTAQQPGTTAGIEVEDGPVSIHRLSSRFPLHRFYNPPPVLTPGLAEYVNQLAPDVVDYHFRWSPSYNGAFRRLRCPRVITYHNTYGEGRGLLGLGSRINDRLYMRTLAHAARVVCVSDRVRRDLVAHGAVADGLRVNYNAVEAAEIEAVAGPPATPLPRPFAVAVGRMVAVKGFDVLIDAWPNVSQPLDLVLVGRGPELERLRRQAERCGVTERVHFPGWVDEAEKIRLLKASVAYVHPARFESFPFSLLEAMAAGAPLVSAGIGGIPEAVGDAGPLLGHDPKEWADTISRVASDAAWRRTLAQSSRQRGKAFQWDPITRDLAAIYREAISATP
jgi:glycosyltransferase involved in cell wall biosynthesis